jgi:hypothetical protein
MKKNNMMLKEAIKRVQHTVRCQVLEAAVAADVPVSQVRVVVSDEMYEIIGTSLADLKCKYYTVVQKGCFSIVNVPLVAKKPQDHPPGGGTSAP